MKKALYWILSLTWGGIMTFIGLITSLVLLCCGYKPKRFGYTFYFEVGYGWGGVSLGAIFITSKTASAHTRCHEHGHGFQNCLWGVLFPFVIALPSVIRCGYREYLVKYKGKKYSDFPPYDSIWFEGQATKWGTKVFG